MEQKYCVYCHTNKINGKRYIGQTCHQDDPSKRWGKNGEGYFDHNIYFNNAIHKYGWENFEHEVLFINLTKHDADLIENALIEFYDTTNREHGYNLRGGGSIGQLSEETKQKLSEACSGWHHTENAKQRISESMKEVRKSIHPWNTGKQFTDEEKSVIYATRIGRKATEEEKRHHSESQRGEKNGFYGKKHSEETRKRISEKNKGNVAWNKGILLSDETKRKIAETNRNKRWVTNGEIKLQVSLEELDKYLNLGFIRGMKIKDKGGLVDVNI